jgi:hypothetical protein
MVAVVLLACGSIGAAAAASVLAARPASLPNLGAHQVACPPTAKTCCPGANCNAHPELLAASPYLVQTAVGTETISPHEIRVGQHFTITFRPIAPSAAKWIFPDIAKKVSPCRTGADLTCTYLALASDVTYPAAASYNGWSDFEWSGGDINGIGVGFDYYAIIGNEIPVIGRLANKHGKGIPQGGVPAPPNGVSPDPGVLVTFIHPHGQAGFAAVPRVNTSPGHPYDVGYYGIALKPGTYDVAAGDPVRRIACGRRVLHLKHPVHHYNFVCKT